MNDWTYERDELALCEREGIHQECTRYTVKDRRSYPGPGEVPSRAAAAWPRARARSGEPEPASAWAIDRHHSSGAPVIRWGRPRACVFSGIWQYRDTTEALLFTTGFFSSVGARGKQRRVDGRSFARKNAAFLRSDCCRLGLFGDPALSSSSTLPHGWVARMRLACWSQMGSDSHR